MGRRPYMALFFSPHPQAWRDAVDTYLQRHLYTIIEPPDDRGSKSMVG